MASVLASGTLRRKVGIISKAWTAFEMTLSPAGELATVGSSAYGLSVTVAPGDVSYPPAASDAPTPHVVSVGGEVLCAATAEDLQLWRDAFATLAAVDNAEEAKGPETGPPFVQGQAAGLTFARCDEGVHCWGPQEGEHFKLRQPGYAKKKQKGPSAPAFYECVAMDTIIAPTRREAATRVALPEWPVASPHPLLPKYIVMNTQVPQYSPGMRCKDDGETLHVVWYYFRP